MNARLHPNRDRDINREFEFESKVYAVVCQRCDPTEVQRERKCAERSGMQRAIVACRRPSSHLHITTKRMHKAAGERMRGRFSRARFSSRAVGLPCVSPFSMTLIGRVILSRSCSTGDVWFDLNQSPFRARVEELHEASLREWTQ
jgi:hypothetical protein